MQDETQGTMEEQLQTLYAERVWMADEIGCCDAESVVDMVRSLEGQLNDLYRTYGSMPASSNATAQLLSHVQELSQHLDGMYSEKSVTFAIENEQPVIKATWKETIKQQGDAQ
jgi:hypothetical protein